MRVSHEAHLDRMARAGKHRPTVTNQQHNLCWFWKKTRENPIRNSQQYFFKVPSLLSKPHISEFLGWVGHRRGTWVFPKPRDQLPKHTSHPTSLLLQPRNSSPDFSSPNYKKQTADLAVMELSLEERGGGRI